MQTVLITGASSGIGRATVKYFAEHGWNVAATMRMPEKETELQKISNVKVYPLDVTGENSIKQAVDSILKDFGSIDVVVNNAGYGAIGAFEAASQEEIKKQFDTNLFGVMNVIRTLLPYFRNKKEGTIINVSSVGGRLTFPIYSLYHSTKWGLEGFSESLQYELRPFNIKIKLIEPGPVKTDFYTRSMVLVHKEGLNAYDSYVKTVNDYFLGEGQKAPEPETVAKRIFTAANDTSFKLRYLSGFLCHLMLFLRWALPFALFSSIMRLICEKK